MMWCVANGAVTIADNSWQKLYTLQAPLGTHYTVTTTLSLIIFKNSTTM